MTELVVSAVMVVLCSLVAALSGRVRAEEFITGCAIAASVLIIYAVLLAYIPAV